LKLAAYGIKQDNSMNKKPPLNWKKPFLACPVEARRARKTECGTPCPKNPLSRLLQLVNSKLEKALFFAHWTAKGNTMVEMKP
jgi:hypothetical protein